MQSAFIQSSDSLGTTGSPTKAHLVCSMLQPEACLFLQLILQKTLLSVFGFWHYAKMISIKIKGIFFFLCLSEWGVEIKA